VVSLADAGRVEVRSELSAAAHRRIDDRRRADSYDQADDPDEWPPRPRLTQLNDRHGHDHGEEQEAGPTPRSAPRHDSRHAHEQRLE
jgi:hypothetical protein